MPYHAALKVAWDKVLARTDEDIARASGGKLLSLGGEKLIISCLNTSYTVDFKKREVLAGKEAAREYIAIPLLHYLAGVKDIPPAGVWISFKELPEGQFYFPAFRQHSLTPLIKKFGGNPDILIKAAKPLGGKALDLGDVAVVVRVFPKLPLAVVFWKGDEEFSPQTNILFDKTAPGFLDTENLAIAAGIVSGRLKEN